MTGSTLRLGTRGSPLARWQAEWVAAQLTAAGVQVELVPITTQGDVQQVGPIGAIGTQGVFTKELQRALLDGRIDLAVHSLKDLPTDVVPGLCLAAVPLRESPGDALVSRDGCRFANLRAGANLGTGSTRRQAQLLHVRPDLRVSDVRGNVDTRLRKLREGQYDALVLAEAGLRRLGLADQITEILPREQILPAVGQGALGLETRSDDTGTRSVLARLDHPPTHWSVLAERGLLAALRGGCLAPVGAWGRFADDGRLLLDAVVLSPDGRQRLTTHVAAAVDSNAAAVELGEQAAAALIQQGASDLIRASRDAH